MPEEGGSAGELLEALGVPTRTTPVAPVTYVKANNNKIMKKALEDAKLPFCVSETIAHDCLWAHIETTLLDYKMAH